VRVLESHTSGYAGIRQKFQNILQALLFDREQLLAKANIRLDDLRSATLLFSSGFNHLPAPRDWQDECPC
jgi:hypothetical protein